MKSLIKNFLNSDEENSELLLQFKLYNDKKAIEKLEKKFNIYMFQLKFLSYMNKCMILHSRKYAQKKFKNDNREIFNLNTTDKDFQEEKINTITGEEVDFIEEITNYGEEIDFKEIIENYDLLKILEKLPQRQREIIYKLIVLQKSQNELVKELGISRQSINKSKNSALNKLRNELMGVS